MIAALITLLPFLPVGLLAGLLAGLLGIGGGLLFSPLLLLMGLDPHQALATSSLAIVPTTLGATTAHLRSGELPWRSGLVLAGAATVTGLICSRLGAGLHGALLLGLQALMYLGLAFAIRPRSQLQAGGGAVPPIGLAAVGAVAGVAGGLLGVGGGLVMVPLMVQLRGLPVHLAIRYSSLAVLASASAASSTFLADGRADWGVGLLLGGTAALAARWSAARLNRVSEEQLVLLLRLLTLLVACDSSRRALLQLQLG